MRRARSGTGSTPTAGRSGDPRSRASARGRGWERSYARKLVLSDTAIVLVAVTTAHLLRFGFDGEQLLARPTDESRLAVSYTVLSAIIVCGWLCFLSLFGSRDPRNFGTGPTEYRRVLSATLTTFGTLAILAFALKSQIGRGYLLIALPLGLLLLLLARWLWRKQLHRQRRLSQHTYRTLIMGEREKSRHVANQIIGNRNAGFELVGAVTERGTAADLVPGVKVLSDYDGLLDCVDEQQVSTLIITAADSVTPQRLKQLGWELEERQVDLIVAASLTDIAGPRIHMRPVADLPLIHVEYPEFSGRKYFLKRLFDIVGSSLFILLLSPVMLAVALAVKLTSPGPVFYSQERIGLNGKPFPMFKFRSMVQNADAQLAQLLAAQGTSDKPLHKVDNDPRITPVGRFIRKYSLDELPQLFNVLLGTMTLVGPRPQREAEVALYEQYHDRRLLVKPGVTGLWQVSGRSNIEWEDAIRLDLYYVENWSITGDIVLLFRTVKTVLMPDGAH